MLSLEKKSLILSNFNKTCVVPGNTLGSNQITVTEKLIIPEVKPDIEQVNQVITNAKVTDTKIVSIKDFRCHQLSFKVIIKGVLKEKIIYTACKKDQPVHSAEFTNPFYGFVLLDFDLKCKERCWDPDISLILANLLKANVCVEDVTVDKVSSRELSKYVTLLLIVTGNIKEIIDTIYW